MRDSVITPACPECRRALELLRWPWLALGFSIGLMTAFWLLVAEALLR